PEAKIPMKTLAASSRGRRARARSRGGHTRCLSLDRKPEGMRFRPRSSRSDGVANNPPPAIERAHDVFLEHCAAARQRAPAFQAEGPSRRAPGMWRDRYFPRDERWRDALVRTT